VHLCASVCVLMSLLHHALLSANFREHRQSSGQGPEYNTGRRVLVAICVFDSACVCVCVCVSVCVYVYPPAAIRASRGSRGAGVIGHAKVPYHVTRHTSHATHAPPPPPSHPPPRDFDGFIKASEKIPQILAFFELHSDYDNADVIHLRLMRSHKRAIMECEEVGRR